MNYRQRSTLTSESHTDFQPISAIGNRKDLLNMQSLNAFGRQGQGHTQPYDMGRLLYNLK